MGRQIMECSQKNVWQRNHLWDETDLDVRSVLQQGKGKITGDFGLLPKEFRWFEWPSCPLKRLPCELDLSGTNEHGSLLSCMLGFYICRICGNFGLWAMEIFAKSFPTSRYDGLGNEERLIYLEVACFMLGESEDYVKRVWCESDAAGLCLESLRLKSLVKLDRYRRITMHDLLRDMGREIVECSHKNIWQRNHLWEETDPDVGSVLQRGKEDAEHFVEGFELDCILRGIQDEKIMLQLFRLCLQDGARLWFDDFGA
ncbi:hypothetical protein L7F22_007784 [Adiantum nelumboides]|nr:hypothetical protein [Adiantum nelumboides]